MSPERAALNWGFVAALRRATAVRTLFAGGVALALMVLMAYAERHRELFGATSRTLVDRVFGALLPLALLGGTTRILLPQRLDNESSGIARFGASRRTVALGSLLACMLTLAVFAAVTAAAVAWVAHDPTAPPRALDSATCAWIGALAGAAYASLFALGATFGARGGGRFVALILDLATGGSALAAWSILTPSAHAQNLLGGAAPLGLSQAASALCLAVLAVLFAALALRRCAP